MSMVDGLMGMKHWWNDNDGRKKTEVIEDNPVPLQLSPTQIPHGLA